MWVVTTKGRWVNISEAAEILFDHTDGTRISAEGGEGSSIIIAEIPQSDLHDMTLKYVESTLRDALRDRVGFCDLESAIAQGVRIGPPAGKRFG